MEPQSYNIGWFCEGQATNINWEMAAWATWGIITCQTAMGSQAGC